MSIKKSDLKLRPREELTEKIFATNIFAKHSEMRNTLTAALLCYYNDMVESLEIVSKKITNGPEFALLKQELQFCKEFLNSINAEHGMDIKVS
ncbi:MAG TPA: hypothetical protein VJ225_03270 [Nitrososphaeraceae archaeon]|nr:hypothetical protein [Nitrososphaeraceae archaeon]